jgi:hypothetical protein
MAAVLHSRISKLGNGPEAVHEQEKKNIGRKQNIGKSLTLNWPSNLKLAVLRFSPGDWLLSWL